MTDRGMMFGTPMILALLAGRKTQTRRILKPQPKCVPGEAPSFEWGRFSGLYPDDWFGYGNEIDAALPFAVGDRLWVRERWRRMWVTAGGMIGGPGVLYPADGRAIAYVHPECQWQVWDQADRSPRHMPRWASRITLLITGVRVERLQSISPADAIAEGIRPAANSLTIDGDTPNPVDAYRALWDSINGKQPGGSWQSDPWVAVVEFTVRNTNIDLGKAA